jgi:hypothetical protein
VTEPMPPIDPRVLELLREESHASRDVRARAKGRLLGAVAAPLGHQTGGDKGPSSGALLARKATVIAFLVGGVVGGALHAAWMKRPPERVVYVDRVVPALPAPPAAAGATPSLAAGDPAVPSVGSVAVPSPPSSAPPSRSSQLTAERAILDEARQALAHGDPARALDRVELHRRSFPSPLLAEERDAMWVQALVKAGRSDDARARGEAFRKRFPDSLFSPAVESALESVR